MLTHVSHVGLWVHDQDEALEFYTRRVGFEVRDDVTHEDMGGYRWLTVGPPRQPELSLILSVPGPPYFDPEAAAEVVAMVARGGMGGFILACEDCRATHAEIAARGVSFHQEPTARFYGIDAAFRDPSGNEIRMVQETRPA